MEKPISQTAVDPSVILEVTGLPVEVLSLILMNLKCHSGMRLGLSNSHLRKWVDANEKFWLKNNEESLIKVNLFGSNDQHEPSPKRALSLGVAAARNLESPEFDGSYVVKQTVNLELRCTMQHGAAFAITTHTLVENFSSYTSENPQFVSFIDMTHWPQYDVLKVPPLQRGECQHSLVGRRTVRLSRYVRFPVTIMYDDVSPLFKKIKTLPLQDRPLAMPTKVSSDNWSPFVSNDAQFERIVIVGFSQGRWVAGMYDFVTHAWSESVVIQSLGTRPHEYFSGVFNGKHFLLEFLGQIAVIDFDSDPLQPKLLCDGPFPNLFPTPPRPVCTLAAEHLLMLYGPTGQTPPCWNTVARIRLDQLVDLEALPTSSIELVCQIPGLAEEIRSMRFTSYGSLAALVVDKSAVVIDLHHKKVLKGFTCLEFIENICFVDSTMFLVFTSHAVNVVDMLSRRQRKDAMPEHEVQLFCYNNKKKKLSERSCPLSAVKSTLDELFQDPAAYWATNVADPLDVNRTNDKKVLVAFRHNAGHKPYLEALSAGTIQGATTDLIHDPKIEFQDGLPGDFWAASDRGTFKPSHSRVRAGGKPQHDENGKAVAVENKEAKHAKKLSEKDQIDIVFCRINFVDSHSVSPPLMPWSLAEAHAFLPEAERTIHAFEQWASTIDM